MAQRSRWRFYPKKVASISPQQPSGPRGSPPGTYDKDMDEDRPLSSYRQEKERTKLDEMAGEAEPSSSPMFALHETTRQPAAPKPSFPFRRRQLYGAGSNPVNFQVNPSPPVDERQPQASTPLSNLSRALPPSLMRQGAPLKRLREEGTGADNGPSKLSAVRNDRGDGLGNSQTGGISASDSTLAASNASRRAEFLRTLGGEELDGGANRTADMWAEARAKFEWLLPQNIRDAQGRRPGEAGYDARTVLVPRAIFDRLPASQKQYWTTKSGYMDTILFFKIGTFYELYEVDAEVGHKEFGWKLIVSGVGKCKQVGISEKNIEDAVQKLVARG